MTRTPLPATQVHLPGLDIAARYQSSRVGGDLFDAAIIHAGENPPGDAAGDGGRNSSASAGGDGRITFLLTDIAGDRAHAHPVAADIQDAFRRSSARIFGAASVNESEGVATLLHEVNRILLSGSRGVCFAPTFLGCYNLQLSILTFINAGGVAPLFRDSDGTRLLESGGLPLGLFSHLTHEPGVQAFEPHASMLLITKGLVEAYMEGSGEQMDAAMVRIRSAFATAALQPAGEICEAVLEGAQEHSRTRRFARFRKPEKADDRTAVALVRQHHALTAGALNQR